MRVWHWAALVTFVAMATSPGRAAETGLVVHWKLDDGAGSTANDDVGEIDGALNGFPIDDSQWVTGKVGTGALQFDGSNDYVAANVADWTAVSYTVALWVKAASTGQAEWSSVFNNDSSNADFQLDVDGGSPGSYRFNANADINFGAVTTDWVHLTVTWDGCTIRAYYDGSLASSTPGGTWTAGAYFGVYELGRNRAADKFFAGTIDDMRVYDRALSASEIEVLAERPCVVVTPATNLSTAEAGPGAVTFTVKLNTLPSDTVVLSLASDDASEGDISSPVGKELTLTTADWSTPQSVTVTGADDADEDGAVIYGIGMAGASSDTGYNGSLGSIAIRNLDDDIDGDLVGWWKLNESSGVTAHDSAGSKDGVLGHMDSSTDWVDGTLGNALNFDGTDDRVRVTEEVIPDGASAYTAMAWFQYDTATGEHVMFETVGNWSISADVVDGSLNCYANTDGNDGSITNVSLNGTGVWHHIAFTYAANGAFRAYLNGDEVGSDTVSGTLASTSGLNIGCSREINRFWDGRIDDVRIYDRVLIIDEIRIASGLPGIVLTPSASLATTEAGGADTFTVRLTAAPENTVTVTLASDDATEGTVTSPTELTFTTSDWATEQTVTVTGQDDLVEDGLVLYNVSLTGSSADLNYNGALGSVSAVNADDDQDTGLAAWWQFDEMAGEIARDSAAANDATLTNMDPGTDWVGGEVGGAVELDGTNDFVTAVGYKGVTGAGARTVAAWIKTSTSADDPIICWGTNAAGQKYALRVDLSFHAVRVEINGGNLIGSTVVNDGLWHHVAVVLPDGSTNVTHHEIYVDGVRETIGASDGQTINTASTTDVRIGKDHENRFFSGAVDDVRIYGRALSAGEVKILARIPGAYAAPSAGLETTEAGGTDSFTVRLNTEPTADVTVNLASDDLGEGEVTVPGTKQLVFTTLNWAVPQSVTITGADDTIEDGKIIYGITMAGSTTPGGSDYDAPLGSVSVTNVDDDMDANLLAWWKLDDAPGSSTAYDSAGTNHGSLSGMDPGTDWITGKVSGALDFDGRDDFIQTGQSLLSGRSAFTIAGWVQTPLATGSKIGFWGQNNCIEFGLDTTVRCWTAGGGSVQAPDALPTGEWHHVAVAGDGTNLKLYVNSVLVATGGSPTSSYGSSIYAFKIGAGQIWGATGNWLDGSVDDVRIYDRALGAADVSALAQVRYWVGGTGSFSDAANHWSMTSGGSPGASAPGAGDTAIFDANSGAGTCSLDGNLSVWRIRLLSGTSMTVSQGSYALATELIEVAAGTFTGGSAEVDVNGDIRVSGGAFTATSGTLSVSGDFEHTGGTFTDNGGSVVLDGADQTIMGSTTFSDLTKDADTRCTLTFEDGETQTITGALTLSGDAGNFLRLRSTTPGQQWSIDPQGTRTVAYLSVQDSSNVNSAPIDATGTGSIDWGNNVDWTFDSGASGPEIMAPTSSTTSPAFVEVATHSDTTAVSFTTDGGTSSTDGTKENDTRWYLDDSPTGGASIGVALDPASAITLSVTATRTGGSATTSQAIAWTVTDLDGQDAATNSVTIREGDSLLLTATGGTGDLTINADGDLTFEWPDTGTKSPGDTYEYRYADAGTYDAEAKIGGVSVGTLKVIVVGTDLSTAIGCEFDTLRTKDIAVTPPDQAGNVVLTVSHPSQVDLEQNVTATGIEAMLTASQTGTTHIYARLGGEDGPIVTTQEVHAFELTWAFSLAEPAIMTFDDGDVLVSGALEMVPRYDGHRLRLYIFAGGTLFYPGSNAEVFVDTDDFDQSDHYAFYMIKSQAGGVCKAIEVVDETE
jgi:hypothetical protein